jgi:transposase
LRAQQFDAQEAYFLALGWEVRAYLKGQKNDLRDVEAIADAVQRLTIRFVATKIQRDLRALHWVRDRLVRQRAGIINRIRAFLPGARGRRPSDANPAGEATVIYAV